MRLVLSLFMFFVLKYFFTYKRYINVYYYISITIIYTRHFLKKNTLRKDSSIKESIENHEIILFSGWISSLGHSGSRRIWSSASIILSWNTRYTSVLLSGLLWQFWEYSRTVGSRSAPLLHQHSYNTCRKQIWSEKW